MIRYKYYMDSGGSGRGVKIEVRSGKHTYSTIFGFTQTRFGSPHLNLEGRDIKTGRLVWEEVPRHIYYQKVRAARAAEKRAVSRINSDIVQCLNHRVLGAIESDIITKIKYGSNTSQVQTPISLGGPPAGATLPLPLVRQTCRGQTA